jgi:hypothetical protein
MADFLINMILPHLDKVFLFALTALAGFGVMLLRKLPDLLRAFARQLADQASRTETKADDAAAAAIKIFADALEKAMAQTFDKAKK